MNKHTIKKKQVKKILDRVKEESYHQAVCDSNVDYDYDFPVHTLSLTDELMYERNINRTLHILIYLDRTNQLKNVERSLKFSILLTPEEKILKKKIEQYRRTHGDPEKIKKLDIHWRKATKYLIAAGLGLKKVIKENKDIIVDDKLKNLLDKNKDRRYFLRHQRDVIPIIKQMMYLITMDRMAREAYANGGDNMGMRPVNNIIYSRLISSIIQAIKTNPSILSQSLKKSPSSKMTRILNRNPTFLSNYVYDNQRKIKRYLRSALNEAYEDTIANQEKYQKELNRKLAVEEMIRQQQVSRSKNSRLGRGFN